MGEKFLPCPENDEPGVPELEVSDNVVIPLQRIAEGDEQQIAEAMARHPSGRSRAQTGSEGQVQE